MRWLRYFRRARRDADFAREIASYIEIETDENIARGMSPSSARDAAVRKFGNATRIREDEYLMHTIGPLDILSQDLRYAFRLIARDKGFALAAVLSLTLGIGANTAIFQLLDAVRLQTLPVASPEELVEVRIPPGHSRAGWFNGRRPNLTYPMLDALGREQQAFSAVIAWGTRRFNTAQSGEVRFVEGLFVSGNYFNDLGVAPVLGRVFTTADDRRGCGPLGAVVSHAYWQRELGGDAAVLSRTIALDGYRFPVLGVTPPGFFGVEVGRMYDVAIPLCADEVFAPVDASGAVRSRFDTNDAWWLAVVARLRPGWTVERATDHLAALSPRLFEATLPRTYGPRDAANYRSFKLQAFPAANGVSNLRANFEQPLVILLITAGLVLVIACANLANLLLARASVRSREIAIRLAIGASRRRIVRQLLVESAVLATAGAVLGGLVAGMLSRLLIQVLAGNNNPSLFVNLTWNWRMLGFTSGVAFVACLLFGVVPALRATALPPAAALKVVGRGLTASRERFGLRRALVVVQVSLSLVLLVGALLFTRTLYNLLTTEAGFSHEGLVSAYITHLSRVSGASTRDAHVLRRDLREQLAALPDVAAVAQADVVPLSGSGFWNETVYVEGAPLPPSRVSNFNRVSDGFFATVGVPLVAGRDFNTRDVGESAAVAIVSEAFVKTFLPGTTPLGRVVRVETAPGEPEPAYEIIGVVKDTKLQNLRTSVEPMVYVASAQEKDPGNGVQFVLRPRGTLQATLPAVSRAVSEFSSDVNVEFRQLRIAIQDSLVRERLMASLSTAFGVLAGLLAAIGLYGVMSYTVARRASEIGIRMAMGARGRDVLWMVLRETLWLIAAGVAAGTALAIATGTFARTLLFELNPTDPTTVVSAAAMLLLIGLFAGGIPARRAAHVDPAVALRED